MIHITITANQLTIYFVNKYTYECGRLVVAKLVWWIRVVIKRVAYCIYTQVHGGENYRGGGGNQNNTLSAAYGSLRLGRLRHWTIFLNYFFYFVNIFLVVQMLTCCYIFYTHFLAPFSSLRFQSSKVSRKSRKPNLQIEFVEYKIINTYSLREKKVSDFDLKKK